jgi:hypothetical protein
MATVDKTAILLLFSDWTIELLLGTEYNYKAAAGDFLM